MSDRDDGGPAFPQEMQQATCVTDSRGMQMVHPFIPRNPGMSLRDWFAGQALTGLLMQGYDKFDLNEWASQAYSYADAMLKARQP